MRIEPNQPSAQPEEAGKLALGGKSFTPFYINLHGYLAGNIGGEIWRFICQRSGNRLEMIDGARVKERLQKKPKGLRQKDPNPNDRLRPAPGLSQDSSSKVSSPPGERLDCSGSSGILPGVVGSEK